MHDLLSRLYRTKMILTCLVMVLFGAALIVVGNQLQHDAKGWITLVPFNEFGGILVGAGLLSIWLDRLLRREQSAIDDLRLRTLFREEAPAMRDAVLEAFAAGTEDLARVATPEKLDQIITNSLSLRLGDEQFASEVYADIRDQAIGAGERWYDATLSIDLQPLSMDRGAPKGSASPRRLSDAHFAVAVRWEYTTIPNHAERRFVCLSDRQEYAELVAQRGASSAWYFKEFDNVEANSREAFELLQFSVDGVERTIRRSERRTAQTYAANVGSEQVKAGQPVTVSYTYRTLADRHGHLLFFDIEQPTRDLSVDFNYGGCGIASVSTLDLVPSVRPTRIERSPAVLTDSTIRVELEGWIFPRSGIAFVWSLDEAAAATRAYHPPRSRSGL
jgi:hypothetical protein